MDGDKTPQAGEEYDFIRCKYKDAGCWGLEPWLITLVFGAIQ